MEDGDSPPKPPLPASFRDSCRLATWQHFEVLVGFLSDPEAKPELRLKVWEVLANRGYGPPKAQEDRAGEGDRVYEPVIYAQPPSQTPEADGAA